MSSKSADFLNFAVDSLDSSSNLLRGLPRKPTTSELSAKFSSAAVVSQPTGRLSPPQDEMMADAPELMHLDALPAFQARNEALQIAEMGGSLSSGLASPSTSTCSGSTTYETYVQYYGQPAQEVMQEKTL